MRHTVRPGFLKQVPAIARAAIAAAAPRSSSSSQCCFSSCQRSNSLELEPSAYGFDHPGTISWDGKTNSDLVSFVGRVSHDVQLRNLRFGLLANASLDISESCRGGDPYGGPNPDGDGDPDHHDHDGAHGDGHYGADHDGRGGGTVHHIFVEFRNDLARSAVAFLRPRDLIRVNGTLILSPSNILGSSFDFKLKAHDLHFVRLPSEAERDDDCFNLREPRPVVPGPQQCRFERWEKYFKDPSQWLDLRHHKACSRSPDFKHKTEGYGLWLDSKMCPQWVKERLQEEDARKAASLSGDIDMRRAVTPSVTDQNHNHHHPDNDIHCEYDPHRGHHKIYYRERVEHVAALWRSFFAAPWEWWDNTHSKMQCNYPDYKHKITGEGLWIQSYYNPPWVAGQLAKTKAKPTVAKKSLDKGTYLNSMTDEELGLTRFEDQDLEPY